MIEIGLGRLGCLDLDLRARAESGHSTDDDVKAAVVPSDHLAFDRLVRLHHLAQVAHGLGLVGRLDLGGRGWIGRRVGRWLSRCFGEDGGGLGCRLQGGQVLFAHRRSLEAGGFFGCVGRAIFRRPGGRESIRAVLGINQFKGLRLDGSIFWRV